MKGSNLSQNIQRPKGRKLANNKI